MDRRCGILNGQEVISTEFNTMKVSSQLPTNISDKKANSADQVKKLSTEELKEKIRAKFGDKALEKKKPKVIEDKVDIKTKDSASEAIGEVGDVQKNDPSSMLTHDKIKQVLKSGAFKFSDRERETLAKILK